MPLLDVRPTLLAAGGNRHPSAADWISCTPAPISPGGSLLAYGAACNVALWDPSDRSCHGLRSILRGSHGHIHAVRFMRLNGTGPLIIVTGSADGVLQTWLRDDASPTGFSESAKIIADNAAAIHALTVLPNSGLLVSAAADYHVSIWSVETPDGYLELSLRQRIKLSPQYFALALDITLLDQDHLILAVAGTKPIVQIFTSSAADISFESVATLTGHEAWVRSLSFIRETQIEGADLILASASQDKYVRLWRIHQGAELPSISQTAADPLFASVKKSLSNKAYRFEISERPYSITFEALLVGHEDWIYSAQWSRQDGQLKLLTASADSSLSVWELDHNSGIWIASARLGEISAQKGATTATGSAGGFWTGLWSPDGTAIVCLGRTGSWRKWQIANGSRGDWHQDLGISGHTASVQNLSWTANGLGLFSTSSDQTTRLFTEWHYASTSSWHEISRPQIHGYDLNCVASLKSGQMVSGADEKLLRVFDEPNAVAQYLDGAAGRAPDSSKQLPDVANIPVLGLSNKAIDATELNEVEVTSDQQLVENGNAPGPLQGNLGPLQGNLQKTTPPDEDLLSKHLLWPEHEKLYGHGYEICALAANHAGSLIATACRATSLDHAVIRLYETQTWHEVKPPLKAHTLTVTSLAFSPDDEFLLSVGRDRQCVVWRRGTDDVSHFEAVATNPKAHTRMALDGSWAPTKDGVGRFVTGGRDKTIHLWSVDGKALTKVASHIASGSVVAIHMYPENIDGRALLAYALEDGSIFTAWVDANYKAFSTAIAIDRQISPALSVTRLAWQPTQHSDSQSLQLAVASEDTSLRIYDISVDPRP